MHCCSCWSPVGPVVALDLVLPFPLGPTLDLLSSMFCLLGGPGARIFPRANVTTNAVTNAPANYYFRSICHCEILRDFAIGRLPQICKVTIVDSGLFDHGESKYAVFVVQLYT